MCGSVGCLSNKSKIVPFCEFIRRLWAFPRAFGAFSVFFLWEMRGLNTNRSYGICREFAEIMPVTRPGSVVTGRAGRGVEGVDVADPQRLSGAETAPRPRAGAGIGCDAGSTGRRFPNRRSDGSVGGGHGGGAD